MNNINTAKNQQRMPALNKGKAPTCAQTPTQTNNNTNPPPDLDQLKNIIGEMPGIIKNANNA
jgi:hypothetical protein